MWWNKYFFENFDFDLFSGLLFFVSVVIICKLYLGKCIILNLIFNFLFFVYKYKVNIYKKIYVIILDIFVYYMYDV